MTTPLDLAVRLGNYEAVKLMLNVGLRDGIKPCRTMTVLFNEIKERADDVRCLAEIVCPPFACVLPVSNKFKENNDPWI